MKIKHILPIAVPASILAITLPTITSCAQQTYEAKYNIKATDFNPGTKVLPKAEWDALGGDASKQLNCYFDNIHNDYRTFLGDMAYSISLSKDEWPENDSVTYDKRECTIKLIKEPDIARHTLYYQIKYSAILVRDNEKLNVSVDVIYKNIQMKMAISDGKYVIMPSIPETETHQQDAINWVKNNDAGVAITVSMSQAPGTEQIVKYTLNKDNTSEKNIDKWDEVLLNIPYPTIHPWFLSEVNGHN